MDIQSVEVISPKGEPSYLIIGLSARALYLYVPLGELLDRIRPYVNLEAL